jgi:hypothetical protein
MNKRILQLSPTELAAFIAERRSLRPITYTNRLQKRSAKKKEKSVAEQLAEELGLSVDQLITKVEDLL